MRVGNRCQQRGLGEVEREVWGREEGAGYLHAEEMAYYLYVISTLMCEELFEVTK